MISEFKQGWPLAGVSPPAIAMDWRAGQGETRISKILLSIFLVGDTDLRYCFQGPPAAHLASKSRFL